ncbi:Neurotensin receptor type 2, partial [Eschrichtius robustus]|nr:Neurotensin receptor type 2 [Eschrichtius robustus]
METSSPRPPGPSPGPAPGLDTRLGVDTRLWAKVLFSALYSLIFALGTAGNALSVHRLVGVPMELYNFVWFHYPWVFGDLGCRAYYFVRELCAYAMVLSVASLSAERCLAVCQPLRARSLLTPRRTRRLLSLVWAASLGLALPMAIVMGQKHELETAGGQPEPASRVCTVLVSRTTLQVFIQVNVLVSFVLPLALTAFLSWVTVSHLEALCSQRPSPSAPGSSAPSHLKLMSEERRTPALGGQAALELTTVWEDGVRERVSSVINATVLWAGPKYKRQVQCDVTGAILAVYVVCWMPYHARRLMYCYVPDNGWTDKLYDFYHYFYLVTNTLFYVSLAVTPVLYNAVSSSFRKLFLEALSSLCREHQPMEPFPPGAPEPRPSGHSLRLWGSPRNPGLDEIEE